MNTLAALIAAHAAALAEDDALDDAQWKTHEGEILHRKEKETREALFQHRPASLAEVREKALYMASCRAFGEWDLDDRIKLIEALTPADKTSPIRALFESWDALRDHSEEKGISQDEVDRRCDETDAVMAEISKLPATDAFDFAAKLSCITHYGAYNDLGGDAGRLGSALIREAAAFCGRPGKVATYPRNHQAGGSCNG